MPVESQMMIYETTTQIITVLIVCGLIAATAYSGWRLRLALKRGAKAESVVKRLVVLVGSLLLGLRALTNLL